MLKRIISSVVLLPVLILLVFLGGMPLKIGLLCASLIGQYECYHAFSKENRPVHIIGYGATVVYYVFLQQIIHASNYLNIFTSVFLVILLIYSVIAHKTTNAYDGIITFFGFFYVCFLLSHIYLVREYQYGKLMMWMIFICAWGCDTGAYFTGMAFGKHKLIPDLSPKKTVEGAVGGVVTATVLALLYGAAIKQIYHMDNVNILFLCGVMGVIGSILAQIGDLAASAMKRYTKIKDFGNLIPGHGGILDRFDSVLLTGPTVYYVMFLLMTFAD